MNKFRRPRQVEADENIKSLLDVKTLLFFIFLIIAAALLVTYTIKGESASDQEHLTSFRPVGVGLRVQVTWDDNLDRSSALKAGETCKKPSDMGFKIDRRPPECSSADVDLWVKRVPVKGNAVLYNSRVDSDTLFSATPDDKGITGNDHNTTFRAEQLMAQFANLPQGTYVVGVDLFRPDALQPKHTVGVCGVVMFNEGKEDEQILFKGCTDLSVTGAAPREATLVSFEVDAEHRLVPGSVDKATQYPIAAPYYATRR